MSRIIIYPYKMGSGSAGVLTEELRSRGYRVLKVFPDRLYSPRRNDIVINWGNSHIPTWVLNEPIAPRFINYTGDVQNASNKLTAFQTMQEAGISIPEFTTNWQEACGWAYTYRVLARRQLTGHSGAGISTIDPDRNRNIEYDRGMYAGVPLFVKYIKKSEEYRVHVFNGQVIDIQQKMRRNGLGREEINYQIRVHNNGWVFTRNEINPPEIVTRESINAVNALGLDFGAVDVIYNRYYSTAYVLEVNTAPGLEGQTINSYATAIEDML